MIAAQEGLAVEAVIWDYDGTIVDSDLGWFRTAQWGVEPWGITIPEEQMPEFMISGLASHLIERYRLPTTRDELRPRLYAHFEEAFERLIDEGTALLPGAAEAIELLAAHLPQAVATGSQTGQVEKYLEMLGLRHYFGDVVGSDKVANPKPAPDSHLQAADSLGVDPRACLAFEDQPRGIHAAKEAGMWVCAIPNLYLPPSTDYSEADFAISSLGRIRLEAGLVVMTEELSEHRATHSFVNGQGEVIRRSFPRRNLFTAEDIARFDERFAAEAAS